MTEPRVNSLSRAVTDRVRSLRQQRGWSTQRLADLLTAQGFPIKRDVLVNLEHKRRDHVTVDELYAIAAAFGIHPDQLVTGPACSVCQDAPPPGFACLNCGANTDRTTA